MTAVHWLERKLYFNQHVEQCKTPNRVNDICSLERLITLKDVVASSY